LEYLEGKRNLGNWGKRHEVGDIVVEYEEL
jgi:hypothetical protein